MQHRLIFIMESQLGAARVEQLSTIKDLSELVRPHKLAKRIYHLQARNFIQVASPLILMTAHVMMQMNYLYKKILIDLH
jgi:hypothetical protein